MLTRLSHVVLFAALITVFMLGVTFAYWHSEQKQLINKRQQVFAKSAEQITNTINLRLSRYELMLRGVKGFYESSGFVTQVEYRNYVEALQLVQTLPGLQGVGVGLYVPAEQVTSYIADMEKRGVPDFRIKPDVQREFYIPISLIEPYSGTNLNAMGFDLNSNPAVRSALMVSRDSGAMVLTNKTNLVQDAGKNKPAVVMYVPIYNTNMPVNTQVERREAIIGWVSGPFRVGDLIAALRGQIDNDVDITIFDGDKISLANRLYGKDDSLNASGAMDGLHMLRTIEVGGKHWTVQVRSLPAFDARFPEKIQLPIAIGGVVLSFLFGWLVWLLGSGRERAIVLAHVMTQELRDVQTDLECTLNAMPDILFELGLDGHYYKYKTSRESLLVKPSDGIIGKKIGDVLPVEAAEICLAALKEANAIGFSTGKQIEIPFGESKRWFELSVARKDGDANENPHFIMISRDITYRRLADSQLRIAAIAFESREGMIVTDANCVVLRVNQAFSLITGYSAEDAIGQTPNLLTSNKQDLAFYNAMWASINSTGAWEGEVMNLRKNGEEYPEYFTITAVKDQTGTVCNYVITMMDITDDKQREQQRLAHEVTLRNTLVREVHHRIKNSLQGVTGLLQRTMVLQPELKDPVTDVIGQIQSIAVIHGLQGLHLNSQVILQELVNEIAANNKSLWQADLLVNIMPNSQAWRIKEEEAVPLALVVNELILNAIKHNQLNKDVRITLNEGTTDHSVILTVTNSGQLLHEADAPHLPIKGTGLTLIELLLPKHGANLSWEQSGELVSARLTLTTPVIKSELIRS